MSAVENIKKDIEASGSYSVEIAVDVKGIPHTFMIITKPNGDEIYRGFAPKNTSLINEGTIDLEIHEGSNNRSSKIKITEEQYNNLMKDINNDIKNPPIYDITNGAHCAVWVAEKLQKANIVDFGVKFDGGFLETIKTNPYFQYFFGIKFPQDHKIPNFLDHKATITTELNNANAILSKFANSSSITLYDPLTLDLNNDGIISTTNFYSHI